MSAISWQLIFHDTIIYCTQPTARVLAFQSGVTCPRMTGDKQHGYTAEQQKMESQAWIQDSHQSRSHYETWLFPCLHKTCRCPPAPGPLPAALCLSGSPLTQPAVLFHCACVWSSPQPKLRPETIFFENFVKIMFTVLVYVQFPFCCLSVHKPGVYVVRYINVY